MPRFRAIPSQWQRLPRTPWLSHDGRSATARAIPIPRRQPPGFRRSSLSYQCPMYSQFLSFRSFHTAKRNTFHNAMLSGRTVIIRSLSSSSSSRASETPTTSSVAAEALTTQASRDQQRPGGGGGESPSMFSYLGILASRLAVSLGIVYVVTQYGIEWTVCEGPSMMPTIQPRGEIVLIDRFTPVWWGLDGGDTIEQRTESARRSQAAHARRRREARKRRREGLLRRYRREEERLRSFEAKPKTESKASAEDEPSSDSKRKAALPTQQEVSSKPSTTKDASFSNSTSALQESEASKVADANDTAEILRSLREDLERMNEEEDEEETWHQPRIPINKLPPEGAWGRFRTQVTTGISVGDVVVLHHPDRIGTVCKRVMGLPGDVVTKPSTRLGASRLDDLLYGTDTASTTTTASSKPALFFESEDERRRRHRRTLRRALASGIEVPDGHVWVEGDNPWNSSDSRNYGAVPANLIMGRVLCKLWPPFGRMMLERGDRPVRTDEEELSLAFSGSIVVPTGWDGQRIVREVAAAPAEPTVRSTPR